MAAALAGSAAPSLAQVPTRVPPSRFPPELVRVDTLPIVAPPLAVGPVESLPDSLQQVADSLQEVPDSLRFYELPRLPAGTPGGWERGVWVWDREDLLSVRAVTLGELLSLAPGMVPVRGGDYGTPTSVTAFGLGGGRIRVFVDGFEMVPLDGGVPDLARIDIGGLESVRLERRPTEIRVELESYRFDDPRPLSLVEAGTGDLRTNHLRGTFVHPRALRGSLGLGIERTDTRGPGGRESGSVSGGWFRYTLHRGDAAGLRFEYRTGTAESELETYPGKATRKDWAVRARVRLGEGVVAEAYTGMSEVSGGEDDGLTPLQGSRRQHGVRLGIERGGLWARGAYRLLAGPDLPSSSLEVEGGGTLPGVGGVAARWSRDVWEGRDVGLTSVTAWTRSLLGVSAFATWEDGSRGSRIFPERVPLPDSTDTGEEPPPEEEPPEEPGPTHHVTERTGTRLGVMARVGPLDLSAARLSFETDSLLPFGILSDRAGVATAGGTFTGLEAMTRLRLPLEGFALYGSLQRWDQTARYLPERVYTGGVDYHGLPMESDNLEIWSSVGVEGRDPMVVPLPVEGSAESPPPLQQVPFGQSWHWFLQIRIVSVRIFFRWDNFTIRQNNQDLPDRVLPPTRTMYGVRWTLWN